MMRCQAMINPKVCGGTRGVQCTKPGTCRDAGYVVCMLHHSHGFIPWQPDAEAVVSDAQQERARRVANGW